MKDERFYQNKDIGFQKAPFAGQNESGFTPVGDLVCVKTDSVDGFAGTQKTIMMLPEIAERHNMGATSGVIVAMGQDAFMWSADRKRPYGDVKPEVGTRVLFTRYSGIESFGADGNRYRVMSDNSIAAVIKETSHGL